MVPLARGNSPASLLSSSKSRGSCGGVTGLMSSAHSPGHVLGSVPRSLRRLASAPAPSPGLLTPCSPRVPGRQTLPAESLLPLKREELGGQRGWQLQQPPY